MHVHVLSLEQSGIKFRSVIFQFFLYEAIFYRAFDSKMLNLSLVNMI